jgi:hypothetical protein
MQFMLIQTEPTPNPATLKFLPGQTVMTGGTRDFATPEDAEASPLADAIFSTGEVEGVFFGRDFISVTAGPGVEWRDLKPAILNVLLDHFSSGAPLFKAGSAADIAIAPDEASRTIRKMPRSSLRSATHRNARPPRRCAGRRRHRLSRLPRRDRVSRAARRLLRLPLLGNDAEKRHRKPAQTLRAGSRGRRSV